jgi:hypothetical protein
MKTTLRKLTTAWPLAIFLLLPALTRAETAIQAWVQRYNAPGNYNIARAEAVDGSNNVIVTGYSTGSGGNWDYATIKYSSAGVPLWTNRYNGPGNSSDIAYAVAVDGNNNVIVTGDSAGIGGYSDYATIKYSSDGVPLWTNHYNGPANGADEAGSVAVDGSNNVIVTGGSCTSGGVNPNCVTIKYSSAGVPLWTNRYTGPGNSNASGGVVAVDGSNNVIVTGSSVGTGVNWWDYATIKYSSAGVPLWTNLYNGPGNSIDCATALAVDASNNVIVTGYSATTNISPLNYDYATIKYSSAGVPLWTNRYNGPGNNDDEPCTVAVDRSGNVIVSGYANGSASSGDWATIKYSGAGVPLWTNLYNGPGNNLDSASAVAVDHSGNVIVAGSSYGSKGDVDFATIKYICVPSPVVTGLPLTNGTFQMRVDDVLQPGTLVIETCTNLAGWCSVFTNTTPTNVLFYTDPDASNSPIRFYWAFQFP